MMDETHDHRMTPLLKSCTNNNQLPTKNTTTTMGQGKTVKVSSVSWGRFCFRILLAGALFSCLLFIEQTRDTPTLFALIFLIAFLDWGLVSLLKIEALSARIMVSRTGAGRELFYF